MGSGDVFLIFFPLLMGALVGYLVPSGEISFVTLWLFIVGIVSLYVFGAYLGSLLHS